MFTLKKNFNKIMDHVFHWEGGYVDHPRDPGGATNMGITIHTMRQLALDLDNDGDIDRDDVRLVTKSLAKDIYKVNYWNAVDADSFPSGIDALLMDAAVNSGPRASVRWLQRALGVTADGVLGPQTRGAVRASQSLSDLIKKTVDERLKSVRKFKNYDTFGKGWENRIRSLRNLALELAGD